MAVKIRLARRGRKKLAIYDVVVADARAPRDGRFIEKLGLYNPNTNPATIEINEDKALNWVLKGAKPTDTVRAMLSYRGIMLKKHLQIGVQKGAITQEEADKKFEEWSKNKEEKITSKVNTITKKQEEEKKARLAAEAKIKEARTQERLEKQKELEASAVEAAREAAGEEETEEEVTDEVAVEETPATETKPSQEKKASAPEAETPADSASQAAAGEETSAEAGVVAEPTQPKAKAEESKEEKEEKQDEGSSSEEEKKAE